MPRRFMVSLDDDTDAALRELCEQHSIKLAQAARIAFARLLGKKLTKAELKESVVELGNPTLLGDDPAARSAVAKKAADARWKQE